VLTEDRDGDDGGQHRAHRAAHGRPAATERLDGEGVAERRHQTGPDALEHGEEQHVVELGGAGEQVRRHRAEQDQDERGQARDRADGQHHLQERQARTLQARREHRPGEPSDEQQPDPDK